MTATPTSPAASQQAAVDAAACEIHIINCSL